MCYVKLGKTSRIHPKISIDTTIIKASQFLAISVNLHAMKSLLFWKYNVGKGFRISSSISQFQIKISFDSTHVPHQIHRYVKSTDQINIQIPIYIVIIPSGRVWSPVTPCGGKMTPPLIPVTLLQRLQSLKHKAPLMSYSGFSYPHNLSDSKSQSATAMLL